MTSLLDVGVAGMLWLADLHPWLPIVALWVCVGTPAAVIVGHLLRDSSGCDEQRSVAAHQRTMRDLGRGRGR